MKIWLKRVGIFLLVPIVCIVFITILLYIPPVQNFVLRQAVRYAGEASGMEIGVERIRLSFPLDIAASGIEVIVPPSDTLLTLQNLAVHIRPAPLVRKIVALDNVSLTGFSLNTGASIEGMLIQGVAGELVARASVYLSEERARVDDITLSHTAVTLLMDSLSLPDSASAPIPWVIEIEKAALEQLCFGMQLPLDADTLRLGAYIHEAGLTAGEVDLGRERYTAGQFTLSGSTLTYDGDNKTPVEGLDPMHIALTKLNISVASLLYHDKELNAEIKNVSTEERSGLIISSFEGSVHSDSAQVSIPEWLLKTPGSEVQLLATIPWSVLADASEGTMQASLTASIGKQDLFTLLNGMPAPFVRSYPDVPLRIVVKAEGNLSALHLSRLAAELPGAFVAGATGKAGEVRDDLRRSADIRLQAQSKNLAFALKLLPPGQYGQFHIPPGIRLNGRVELKDRAFSTRLLLTEAKARINAGARYQMANESYRAYLAIDSLEPVHFMPGDSLMWLSAVIGVSGQGTDVFGDKTWMNLKGKIDSVCYINTALRHITLSGSLKEHQAQFEMKNDDPLAAMDITLDGTIRKEEVKGMLIINVDSIDLYNLHLVADTFSTSFQLFAEAESNLHENHKVDITLGNWEIATTTQRFKPKTLTLRAQSAEDTTRVSFHTGDLEIVLTGNAGLEAMTARLAAISDTINKRLKEDSTVNIAALRPSLPDMSLQIHAERDNPVYNILQQYDMGFSRFHLNATASPEEGLRLDANLYALHRDTFLIDTVRASVRPDSAGLIYQVDVLKNRYLQQTPFTAQLKGSVKHNYMDAEALYVNNKNETGLLTGVRGTKGPDGIHLQFYPEQQILAFYKFSLNRDNYIRFKNAKEIDANVTLTAPDNTSFRLHTVDRGGDFPEVHTELSQLDLKTLSDGFQLPAMNGVLSADMRYAPSRETFMVVLDANVDTFLYQKGRVGGLMFNTVYLPLDNDSHQVDVHFSRDQEEIATATAVYQSEQDAINGDFTITSLPLQMLSPFIPDRMASLSGMLNGEMQLTGTASAPLMNGTAKLDSGAVYVDMAASSFRFDDKEIKIKDSRLSFDKYNVYAAGSNPFVISGIVDVTDLSHMTADLRLGGNQMQLLNARRTPESLVYGKLYADLSTTLKGPLSALDVRGNIKLLGGTNLTYVMTESALTVQDRLKDLVSFTSFADTLIHLRRRRGALPLGGMNMSVLLQIEPAVQLRADLSPDRSSYAEVVGGGSLSFQYTSQGNMFLNGRYTFSEGNVNYALPVIPLKKFRIEQGSYVQWDGEMMNPLLNIKATERMRASAAAGGGTPRMVNFDAGLTIRDRLNSMKLEFLLSTPD
ncbi:MAG: translocation/assembly module TamB domain-containing protein, partial [Tannerellaceae bacterium]|nr:translocation/assembly module TamB domain-containing protein [Tannerellaceae bacterium]